MIFFVEEICNQVMLIVNEIYENSIKFEVKKLFSIVKIEELDEVCEINRIKENFENNENVGNIQKVVDYGDL